MLSRKGTKKKRKNWWEKFEKKKRRSKKRYKNIFYSSKKVFKRKNVEKSCCPRKEEVRWLLKNQKNEILKKKLLNFFCLRSMRSVYCSVSDALSDQTMGCGSCIRWWTWWCVNQHCHCCPVCAAPKISTTVVYGSNTPPPDEGGQHPPACTASSRQCCLNTLKSSWTHPSRSVEPRYHRLKPIMGSQLLVNHHAWLKKHKIRELKS